MKKNRLMRASVLLLVLTLVTSCFVGGTFAKYTSKAAATDTARVAKWGVVIEGSGTGVDTDGSYLTYGGSAFSYVYHGPNSNPVNTVYSSGHGDNVVAPGTSGTFEMLDISGTPEVMVNIETTVDVELTGSWEDQNGDFYCPLVFTINNTEWSAAIHNINTEEEFEEGLETVLALVTNAENISANTNLAEGSSLPALFEPGKDLTWTWPYSVDEDTDLKDTHLGNIAAGTYVDDGEDPKEVPNITITFTTTVTQVD